MAGGNPLVNQGVLNRVVGSVIWDNFTNLNVTAPYLGKEGLRLALEGQATGQHDTMLGLVQSPEPYMPLSVIMHLIKTQSLAAAYQSQWEISSVLGGGAIYPDVPVGTGGITPFDMQNMAIMSIREMPFDGSDPIMAVTVRGFYNVNSALFS